MILERGARLNNRYKILEILGQGGMGSIYRALDENLGMDVAVKHNLFTTDEYARQFRREAVILANLRHPNLPRVTDHFVIEGQGQYLVMDYIEGEDLRERMDRIGLIPEDEAILIGAAICDALAYLASRNPPVIHRDIKPGNVKITPQGQIYLVDFGLAKVVTGSHATTTGARAMTPGYSPPEQYGTARTDHRSDIFSLGATLYAAMTGMIAEDALARAMDQTELTPVRKHNPRISKRTAMVIEKALSVKPDDRYQRAEEFKAALLSARYSTRSRPTEYMVEPPPGEMNVLAREEIIPSLINDSEPDDGAIRPLSPVNRPAKASQAERVSPDPGFSPSDPFSGSGLPSLSSILPADSGPIASLLNAPAAGSPEKKRLHLLPVRRNLLRGCWMVVVAVLLAGIVFGAGAYVFDPSLASRALALFIPPVLTTAQPSPTGTMQPSPTYTDVPPTATPSPTIRPTQAVILPTRTSLPSATPTPQPTPMGGSGQIAFASDRSGKKVQIYLADVDEPGLRAITDLEDGACQPTWSPDGMRLAYISPCEGSQEGYVGTAIYIINLENNSTIQIPTVPGGGDYDPAWSPDGRTLLFTSVRNGSVPRLYAFSFEDESVIRLSAPNQRDQQPVWSPDGKQVAFVTNREGAYQVWLMDPDGSSQRRLTTSGSKVNLFPAWSPDGQWLIFTQLMNKGAIPMLFGLPLVREGAYQEIRISKDSTPMREAKYSPDGYWIVYEGWPDGKNHEIFIMTSNGTNRTPLATSPGLDFDPAWRPVQALFQQP